MSSHVVGPWYLLLTWIANPVASIVDFSSLFLNHFVFVAEKGGTLETIKGVTITSGTFNKLSLMPLIVLAFWMSGLV